MLLRRLITLWYSSRWCSNSRSTIFSCSSLGGNREGLFINIWHFLRKSYNSIKEWACECNIFRNTRDMTIGTLALTRMGWFILVLIAVRYLINSTSLFSFVFSSLSISYTRRACLCEINAKYVCKKFKFNSFASHCLDLKCLLCFIWMPIFQKVNMKTYEVQLTLLILNLAFADAAISFVKRPCKFAGRNSFNVMQFFASTKSRTRWKFSDGSSATQRSRK